MVYYKIVCADENYDSDVFDTASEAWADFKNNGGTDGKITTGTSFNAAYFMKARHTSSRTTDGMGRYGELPDLVWDGVSA